MPKFLLLKSHQSPHANTGPGSFVFKKRISKAFRFLYASIQRSKHNKNLTNKKTKSTCNTEENTNINSQFDICKIFRKKRTNLNLHLRDFANSLKAKGKKIVTFFTAGQIFNKVGNREAGNCLLDRLCKGVIRVDPERLENHSGHYIADQANRGVRRWSRIIRSGYNDM